MDAVRLHVLIEPAEDGGWVVRSPAVGIWSDRPVTGELLEGDGVGRLHQAGRWYLLRLPEGKRGVVREIAGDRQRQSPVEWGQELFRLGPVSGAAEEAGPGGATDAATGADLHTICAPTDGVFYSRPTPDAAPFVKPGDTVSAGQPVGLIEVMKTFNQVLFEGPDVPRAARIETVLVEDGREVRAGAPLVRFQPD